MNGAQTSDMSSSTGPHLYLVTLPEPVRGKHLRNASIKRDATAVSKGICNSRHCHTFTYSKTLAWNTQMCYCEKIMVTNCKIVFWWPQPAAPVHHYYYYCLFLSLQKQHNVVFNFTKIYLHINSIYLHATREISDPATNSLIAVAGLHHFDHQTHLALQKDFNLNIITTNNTRHLVSN